jgi:iron complex outermembrane receptor protein
VRQLQGGARLDHAFSDATSLRLTAYGGNRDVRQNLALTGVASTSSGGVVDLEREYGGASLKLFQRARLLDGPATLTLGVDYDEQRERRRGFVNNFGDVGDLRRDEDDKVRNTDWYAQFEWRFLPRASLLAGVRGSEVRFRSEDHYVTAANPDDSGSVNFRKTTPVAGFTFHATDGLNVYATYGEGFETPTFAELAYRPGGTGLNFALSPATSQAVEVGVKAIVAGRHRLNGAWFAIDTDDEIVIDAATGGRTTFRNAGKTRRRGVELAWDGELPYGLAAHAAYTYLDAEFATGYVVAGTPPVVVPAGAKLPGVPKQTAYGELAWTPPAARWFTTAVEVQYVDRIFVNDRNSDAAPAYTVVNLRAGVAHAWDRLRLSAFARVNNVADRNYVGSVIVGDTNSRFFEPAPGRNWFAGASVDVRL